MGSLIEYFKKKTAENVLEKAIKHAQKVQVCVKELDKGIEILIKEKNRNKSHDIFINVDLIENEADSLRREILADISKGELHPSIRTDLSHLIKRLDDVANCATGVARRIDTIAMTFWEQSSPETLDLISKMMKVTVECGDYLDKIVIDLLGDRTNIKEYNNQINKLEHDVDVLNIKLRESLQYTNYDINAFTVFTVGNTMDIIEAISDAMEVVADYIMLLLRSANVL
jgi:predicted phosphate transport protein (TIGR00153 family)